MCGSWQDCSGPVLELILLTIFTGNPKESKSIATPLPGLLLFSPAPLSSACYTTLIPLFYILANLMWHYIRCVSKVQIGWIYSFLFKKFVPVEHLLLPNPDTSFLIVTWVIFSDVLSAKANFNPAATFLFFLR